MARGKRCKPDCDHVLHVGAPGLGMCHMTQVINQQGNVRGGPRGIHDRGARGTSEGEEGMP